jgi:hypothetical protein
VSAYLDHSASLADTVDLDSGPIYQFAGGLRSALTLSEWIRKGYGLSMSEAEASEKHKQDVFGRRCWVRRKFCCRGCRVEGIREAVAEVALR